MTITEVLPQAVRLPITTPTHHSTRPLTQRDHLVVTVVDSDTEHVGQGYAYVGTAGGAAAAQLVRELLAPTLLGADSRDIVGLWRRMYQETLIAGRRGMVVRALSAIDIALWDLAAKRAGVPLAVLLGGSLRPLPAYASGGYYRPGAGSWTDAVVEEIRGNRALGFTDHKIKVGGLPVAQDAERVAAAADAMGPGGRLAVDANNSWPNAAEALRAIRVLEAAAGPAGLWWVEEPLSPDDVAGHRALAQALETPVATGEIHQTRHEFRALIEQQAADVLQPDAGVLGGVTEYLTVARTADTFGVPVAPHWHANLHAHLAAATPNTLTIEHFALEKGIYNFEDLLVPETRLQVADGHVLVPDLPGLGIEFDQAVLREHDLPS